MAGKISDNKKSIVICINDASLVSWRAFGMSSAEIIAVLNKVIYDNLKALSSPTERVEMQKVSDADEKEVNPDNLIDSYIGTI
ncbi:MAG: hypothetical protein WC679_14170 [Bacteroidales bacterium]